MIKIIRPDTAIRIQIKDEDASNDNGFSEEIWLDIVSDDIFCQLKNKYGAEVYKAAAVQAQEPATIRLWYVPGVTPDCRVVRLEDEAIFEIINIDDVMNRHQQLEIEIKRFDRG